MSRGVTFWIPMIVFQVAFGLTIFAITREVYMHAPAATATARTGNNWSQMPGSDGGQIEILPLAPEPFMSDDPAIIASQADQFFANKQYDKAAELYQRLLASGSIDVNTYNSLGLTLQYLGRSADALQVLNEGIALDPSYQRIWLTMGFVNIQMGNIEQARNSLGRAIELGPDTEIGQSAAKMLAGIPAS
jgi:tetratricopeptide (TPR) repeat protein